MTGIRSISHGVGYIISTFDEYTMSLFLKGNMGCSASISARLLNVLSVFAVFSLLHFEPDLPGGRYRLESVLQPNEVLTIAPVRRHQHACVIFFCLWNLPSYLVRVHVPVLLPANRQLGQPIARHVADLLLHVL